MWGDASWVEIARFAWEVGVGFSAIAALVHSKVSRARAATKAAVEALDERLDRAASAEEVARLREDVAFLKGLAQNAPTVQDIHGMKEDVAGIKINVGQIAESVKGWGEATRTLQTTVSDLLSNELAEARAAKNRTAT